MQRYRLAPAVLGLVIALVASVFIACGGGGMNAQQLPENTQQQAELPAAAPAGDAVPQSPAAESLNRVILEVPTLQELQAGDEFEVQLSMEAGQEIHQGVLRLSFDQATLVPVAVEPGSMLPQDMIHIADIDNSGFLPLAFTALPGGRDIAEGSGVLYTLRFRLLGKGAEAGRIGFVSDAEFLQLRDRAGQHIAFDVETRAGGSHAE